ncbi:MAG TPA: hypothetical protein VGS41_18050, partial [Chthonomonadales bacterium]|nr:hypothetical protein [Chthonomonadales bacterium]
MTSIVRDTQSPLRNLPAMNRLLRHPEVAALGGSIPAQWIAESARQALLEARREVERDGSSTVPNIDLLGRRTVEIATRRA